mmetsp:Transcript_5238/g.15908  ORF Transcript_5238/g.15908 Transcript_5238/m.15908 type:complete len:232 (-) Transcript_5238:260-955(-)
MRVTLATTAFATCAVAFAPAPSVPPRVSTGSGAAEAPARHEDLDRRRVAASLLAVIALPGVASARGRGTQPAMFQRYSPRIVSFGEYLKSELPAKIEAADWAAVKADTEAEINKKKGPVGALYRGTSAMSLWASTYSETAVTPTQKELDAQVDVLVDLRAALAAVADKGMGNTKKTGGIFGFGAKQEPPPPPSVLKREAFKALASAKTAYNEYVAVSNKNAPFEISPLPSI